MALDLTKAKPTPPPSRGGGGTSRAKPTPISEDRINRRSESVSELFGMASLGLLMVGQAADSQAMATHGPKIAVETAKLAESNEQVAKVADWLGMVGPYAGMLTSVLPLILQIAVNHGRVPAGVMGTTSPAVLQAQAEANLARKAADMLEEQNRASAEAAEQLARAQAAYAEAQAQQAPSDAA